MEKEIESKDKEINDLKNQLDVISNTDSNNKELLLDAMPWSKKLPKELRVPIRK